MKSRLMLVGVLLGVLGFLGWMLFSPLPKAPAPASAGTGPRGFLMGFSSWPHAATPVAERETYAFIGAHADLVAEQLDEGVPWAEALSGGPFPEAFQAKLEAKRKHRPEGMKLLLSLTALSVDRNGWAEGVGGAGSLPESLKDKGFDDPQRVRAYADYCARMVEFFQPDFLLVGIEANELLDNRPEAWPAYHVFSREVRRQLRERFPQLPVSQSVTLHKLADRQNPNLAEYRALIREFVEDQDFFAVSFFPFFRGLHIEPQFLAALGDLPVFAGKPIAITETGHPAEPIHIRTWKIDFESDPLEQASYLEALLARAQTDHYLFVTWWAARDFDALWKTFPESAQDLGALWRDTGLLDEAGQSRPAAAVWQAWFSRPYRGGAGTSAAR
jgi:hypothetical protein